MNFKAVSIPTFTEQRSHLEEWYNIGMMRQLAEGGNLINYRLYNIQIRSLVQVDYLDSISLIGEPIKAVVYGTC